MATMTTEELLGVFEEMTVLELKEFLDAFEEHFDVTAAAPMAMAVAAGDGAGAEEAAEEQTEFDVVLTGSGDKKIQVIKEVRAMTSLGLKEAKAVVDGLPSTVLEAVSKEEANAAKEKIEAVGGSVEIR
ncbi:MAG: 50S ribosomal protein L7/L12 [Acidimicrobiia bacterium]|nr:50S ribosomal protein L7/L12 [Acidimicrobiia bacterium]MYB45801.1 50S ribosomal protein L7/L12 [Acidimicrobiia bacterium]MYC85109.1 50S ribosomal protein L7/L12 [Acidimicrobiia bacterium]